MDGRDHLQVPGGAAQAPPPVRAPLPEQVLDRVLVPQPLVRMTPRKPGGKGFYPQYVAVAGDLRTCSHPPEAISLHGSNQFGQRQCCMACNALLVAQGRD